MSSAKCYECGEGREIENFHKCKSCQAYLCAKLVCTKVVYENRGSYYCSAHIHEDPFKGQPEEPPEGICAECRNILNGSTIVCEKCGVAIHTKLQCKRVHTCYTAAGDTYICSKCNMPPPEAKKNLTPIMERPLLFTTAGSKQLVEDAIARKKDAAYQEDTTTMRNFAIRQIEMHAADCMDYISGNLEALEIVRSALDAPENLQQAVLAARLAELRQPNEWGTQLTLIMMAAGTGARVRMFIQDPNARVLQKHPALSSVGSVTSKFQLILVHDVEQRHWCCAFPEAEADKLKLTGVKAETAAHEMLVLMGQPGDGRCQFSSFFVALKHTRFEMAKLAIASDSDQIEAGHMHGDRQCPSPSSNALVAHMDHESKVWPDVDDVVTIDVQMGDEMQKHSMRQKIITADNFQEHAHSVTCYGDVHIASPDEVSAIAAWRTRAQGGTRATTIARSAPQEVLLDGTVKVKTYRSIEFPGHYSLSSGEMVFDVGLGMFGIVHSIYCHRRITSSNNYAVVYLGQGADGTTSYEISIINKIVPTLLPCKPMRICSGELWNENLKRLPISDWIGLKHRDRLQGEVGSSETSDAGATPKRRSKRKRTSGVKSPSAVVAQTSERKPPKPRGTARNTKKTRKQSRRKNDELSSMSDGKGASAASLSFSASDLTADDNSSSGIDGDGGRLLSAARASLKKSQQAVKDLRSEVKDLKRKAELHAAEISSWESKVKRLENRLDKKDTIIEKLSSSVRAHEPTQAQTVSIQSSVAQADMSTQLANLAKLVQISQSMRQTFDPAAIITAMRSEMPEARLVAPQQPPQPTQSLQHQTNTNLVDIGILERLGKVFKGG